MTLTLIHLKFTLSRDYIPMLILSIDMNGPKMEAPYVIEISNMGLLAEKKAEKD
jgi:hypothetical protein